MDKAGGFAGPAGEPQAFVPGDVIVDQPDGKGGGNSFRKVDAQAFKETYTSPNGLPFGMAQSPEDGCAAICKKLTDRKPGLEAKPAAPKMS